MTQFSIEFQYPVTEISAPGATIHVSSIGTVATRTEETVDVAACLASIQRSLSDIERDSSRQAQEYRESLVYFASQIAKAAVNSHGDLVEERVKYFAEAAIAQMAGNTPKTILVHPDCKAVIQEWCESGEQPLTVTVQGDPSIEPGDCIVESEGSGTIASLENLLEVATQQLVRATNA